MKKISFTWTWKAFWIRQIKTWSIFGVGIFFLWNIVEIGHAVYGYFGWVLEGYGPPEQRWYRVITSGLILVTLFGTLIDALNTWHYLKNPHEIPNSDADDESK